MKMWKNALCALLMTGMFFCEAEANANSFAGPDPASLKLKHSEKSKSFGIFFNPLKQEKSTILLKDLDGYVLWREQLDENEDFAKLVNLRNLPDGQYTVAVTDKTGELLQPVLLEKNLVTFDAGARTYYHYPEFTVYDDMIRIELLTDDQMSVKVEVTDLKGETLYSDYISVNYKLIQNLDISNLENGTYTVKVKTPYRSFYKDIVR